MRLNKVDLPTFWRPTMTRCGGPAVSIVGIIPTPPGSLPSVGAAAHAISGDWLFRGTPRSIRSYERVARVWRCLGHAVLETMHTSLAVIRDLALQVRHEVPRCIRTCRASSSPCNGNRNRDTDAGIGKQRTQAAARQDRFAIQCDRAPELFGGSRERRRVRGRRSRAGIGRGPLAGCVSEPTGSALPALLKGWNWRVRDPERSRVPSRWPRSPVPRRQFDCQRRPRPSTHGLALNQVGELVGERGRIQQPLREELHPSEP